MQMTIPVENNNMAKSAPFRGFEAYGENTSSTGRFAYAKRYQISHTTRAEHIEWHPNILTTLRDLSEQGLKLRLHIPVLLGYSSLMDAWIATEDSFGWHGVGGSVNEAIEELSDSIAEDYVYLSKWPGQLAPHLAERMAAYRKYIVDASED